MKISIITINLNNARGLAKTLASVKAQTYLNIEYIIIDGGSTDASLEIIKNSKERLDYWASEKDSGIYQAMNKGVAKATGDYLLFLNSGDSLTSNEVIKTVIPYLNNEDIVFGNINTTNNVKIGNTIIYPDILNFNYFITGALPHQGMFIKRTLFSKVGNYNENLKLCSDWKFQLDAICKFKCNYKHINLTIADFSAYGMSSHQDNQNLIRQEKENVLINEYSLFREDLQLLKEYRDLAYYYHYSDRVQWFRKFNILKNKLSGRFSKNYKHY